MAAVLGVGLGTVPADASARADLDAVRVYAHSSGVLTGHDFPADSVLRLSSGNALLSVPDTVTTDSTGHLSVAYHADAALGQGQVQLTARATTSGFTFSDYLDTGRAQLDNAFPSQIVYQAGTVHAVIQGFAADEPITVSCPCSPVLPRAVVTDGSGAADFDVHVAGPRHTDDTRLTVTGSLSGRAVSAPFTFVTSSAVGPQRIPDLVSNTRMFSVSAANGTIEVDQTIGTITAGWQLVAPYRGTSGNLFLQSDGNLVVRDNAGRALWQSHTAGAGPDLSLTMQDDGNLVLRAPTGRALWVSGTFLIALTSGQSMHAGESLRGSSYSTQMQSGGNLVLSDRALNPPLVEWASRTQGAGAVATVQSDGNLVVRLPSGRAAWSTGTAGRCPAPRLSQQFDGNLVLRSTATGTACWASGTRQRTA